MALDQMETAYDTLLQHPTVNTEAFAVRDGSEGRTHPFIVTLGGDHTIVRFRLSIIEHLLTRPSLRCSRSSALSLNITVTSQSLSCTSTRI
jgi:hypothetical protein